MRQVDAPAGDRVEQILRVRRESTCTARTRRTRAQQLLRGVADDPPARPIRGRCAPKRLDTLANGTRIAIKDVKVRDMVLATDPETGESGAREVVATLPHTDHLLTLRLSSGDVVTTEDHRYWNETDREWQESQHLDAGDQLLTADGDIVTVEGLDWSTVHTADAYDLDVADLDSFYVGAGDDEVLVHNCNIGFSADTVRSAYQGMRSGGGHAMRHLIKEGLIPNAGSLAQRAQQFERLTSPILTSPSKTFDWVLGGTSTRAFAGTAAGRQVVRFVAKEGPYQGRVLSSVVPDAKQVVQWGL